MSLPAASLSAFFASSLRLYCKPLYCKLWRRVREDVETESTIGFMGEALGTAKEAAGRKEAGTAKEGKLILARKEGWYCQGRKLAKEAGVLPKMEARGQGSADMGRESVRFLVSGR